MLFKLKTPQIALIIGGLLAAAVLFYMSRSKVPSSIVNTGNGNGTIKIPKEDGIGQLLVPTGGLDIVGSQTPTKKLLDAKCECNNVLYPGQCCWTANVISPRFQNTPQPIGPYCLPKIGTDAQTCNEIKTKFLQANVGAGSGLELGLSFADVARVTIA